MPTGNMMKALSVNKIYLFYFCSMFFIFSMGLWSEAFISLVNKANLLKWTLFISLMPIFFIHKKFRISCAFNYASLGMFGFIFVTAISTITSSYLDNEGFQNLLGYLTIWILAFLLPVYSSTDKMHVLLFNSIGIVSTVTVLLGLLLITSFDGWGGARFRGVFHNTNMLGSTGVIASIYTLTMYSKLKNKLFLALLICSLISIFLTQSRGALVAALVFLTIQIFQNMNVKKVVSILFIGLFLLSLTHLIKSNSDDSSFQPREFKTSLDPARVAILNRHTELFIEKPFLGQGLSGDINGGRFAAELAYTDILSFSGLIGGSTFIFVLFLSTLLGCKIRSTQSVEANGNYFIFISVLLLSIGDGYISNLGNPLPLFAWFYIATLARSLNGR